MVPEEWLKFSPKPKELTGNEKWNVFLSYRSVNRGWVLNLYDVLTELGYKVFLDQYVLKSGDTLIEVLQNGLAESQSGVLIWTHAAGESDWVKKEYYFLLTKATNNPDFRFVPVRIDRAPLPGFADLQIFIDFSEYPDGPNGGDLLRLLHGIVGKPLSPEAVRFAFEQDEAAGIEAAKISAAVRNKRPDRLLQLFRDGGLPWKTTAALACKSAEGLTKLGNNDEAIEILNKIGELFPKAIRPKQLKALALARRGQNNDLNDAQDILGELYELNHLDPETLGIYGRTCMDRYKKSGDLKDLRESRNLYELGFTKVPSDYYTGINAASKSILLGEIEKGSSLALLVEAIVGKDAIPGDYWKTATVAETFLIQKKFKEAAQMYQNAVDIAPAETASHQSTWSQAKNLMEKLKPSEEEYLAIKNAFKTLNGFPEI